MQDNAQNNWKQLLENADDLRAEVLKDKNAAWEKLYTSLHNKPTRKLTGWYWAAACLLAIGIISSIVIINKEKHQTSVTISSPTIQTPAIKKQPLQTAQKKSEPSFLSSSEKSKKLFTIKNKAARKNESAYNNQPFADLTKEQDKATITAPALNFDSSVKEIVNAPPVKKKLRVVHINDLGQPAEASTADNKLPGKHGFQLRILNSEYYNPSSAGSQNNGLLLFKSQNTSN